MSPSPFHRGRRGGRHKIKIEAFVKGYQGAVVKAGLKLVKGAVVEVIVENIEDIVPEVRVDAGVSS